MACMRLQEDIKGLMRWIVVPTLEQEYIFHSAAPGVQHFNERNVEYVTTIPTKSK